MTKKEQNKIRVEERKSMRVKFAQAAFMSRTRSIYTAQKKRAEMHKSQVAYSMEDLRDLVRAAIGSPDPYNADLTVTVKNMAVDHDTPVARGGTFGLDNLVVTTAPSNQQNGILTGREWRALTAYMLGTLPAEAIQDLRQRLSIGGKFKPKK